jgi:hypothetical protein
VAAAILASTQIHPHNLNPEGIRHEHKQGISLEADPSCFSMTSGWPSCRLVNLEGIEARRAEGAWCGLGSTGLTLQIDRSGGRSSQTHQQIWTIGWWPAP